jgi:AcrR family transcriptional regulator
MKKRQSIINIARKTFIKYGFQRTTIKDITNSIGQSRSTFYYYFNSKEEIFKAVLEVEIEEFKNIILEVVKRQTEPMEKLRTYFQTRIIGLQQMKNIIWMINTESLSNKTSFLGLSKKLKEVEAECLSGILQLGVINGIFQTNDITMEINAISSTIQSLGRSLNQFSNIKTSQEKLDQIQNIIFFGIINQ